MSDEKFKLPGSSYEELVKIIKVYGDLTKPASPDKIKKLTAFRTTNISRDLDFLVEIGVLQGIPNQMLTKSGKILAHALDHEMPDEIQKGWRNIVQVSEFLTRLLASIQIRQGMAEETLISHIAYSAGQPNRSSQITGARTVIDILCVSGRVWETDGQILPIKDEIYEQQLPKSSKNGDFSNSEIPEVLSSSQVVTDSIQTVSQSDRALVHINIDLKVECKPEDLDTIGSKLRNILDSVSKDAVRLKSES
ncbi:MAG: hypothetical protein AAGG51_09270 [Cyanobacteria bacterium P01_G01_bin.54]